MVVWKFTDSSVGKESAWKAGDPGLIPGLGRSGIKYKFQKPENIIKPQESNYSTFYWTAICLHHTNTVLSFNNSLFCNGTLSKAGLKCHWLYLLSRTFQKDAYMFLFPDQPKSSTVEIFLCAKLLDTFTDVVSLNPYNNFKKHHYDLNILEDETKSEKVK